MIAMVPSRATFGFAAALLASLMSLEARAEDASPWQRDGHSAVRLLAGSHSGAVLLGGIAFQLEPGWKTYWRTPGDSGVPPRFDFSKSENIESVTILWPAPTKFADGTARPASSVSPSSSTACPQALIRKAPRSNSPWSAASIPTNSISIWNDAKRHSGARDSANPESLGSGFMLCMPRNDIERPNLNE